MDTPEHITQIYSYLQTKKQRRELEKKVAPIRKLEQELEETKSKEVEQLAQISQDSLITTKTVKAINGILSSSYPLELKRAGGEAFPVSFANLILKRGRLQIAIVFEKPLFCGWETENPYSYQFCPWSLDTPDPPSKNHTAQYAQVTDQEVDVVCWEQVDGELGLWGANGTGAITFLLGGGS